MQCPRCFQDFEHIEKHKKCNGVLPVSVQKEKFPSLWRAVFHSYQERATYGDNLELGFAMMSDRYED